MRHTRCITAKGFFRVISNLSNRETGFRTARIVSKKRGNKHRDGRSHQEEKDNLQKNQGP